MLDIIILTIVISCIGSQDISCPADTKDLSPFLYKQNDTTK